MKVQNDCYLCRRTIEEDRSELNISSRIRQGKRAFPNENYLLTYVVRLLCDLTTGNMFESVHVWSVTEFTNVKPE